MTLIFRIISSLIIIGLLESCQQNSCPDEDVDFCDTLRSEYIYSIDKGDTNRLSLKTYFSPTDKSISVTNFYYDGCTQPCEKNNIYHIYFPRKEVIDFCDSTIADYVNLGGQDVRYDCVIYAHIKEQALANKMNDAIYAEELSTLLDRFIPFIVNPISRDTPKYIIKINQGETYGGEYLNYVIKAKNCDTVHLATKVIRPQAIDLNQ